MKPSMTIAGAIAMLLSLLANIIGIELPYATEEIESAIVILIGLVGFIVTIVGRYRKGDINIFGFKKPVSIDPLPVGTTRDDEIE